MKPCIRDCFIALEAECSECEDSIQEPATIRKYFASLTRKRNCKAIHVLARPLKCECSYQNEHLQDLTTLLRLYSSVFQEKLPSGLPPNKKVQMNIDLRSNAKPKIRPKYKVSRNESEELRPQLETTISKGFSRPSTGLWVNPVLPVAKKTGELRMWIDYRVLNIHIIKT